MKPVKVRDYDSHVLVCDGTDCRKRGSKGVRKEIKSELKSCGANRDVRLDSTKCLGLCKHGPNVVVYPSGTWYTGLDRDDAKRIVEGHLRDGEPVQGLAAEFRARRK